MKFLDVINEDKINEARRITIDTPTKGGTTAGELLIAFYNDQGTNTWGVKEGTRIKKPFGKDAGGHQYRLIDDGYIDRNGRQYSISQKGLKYIASKGINVQGIGTSHGGSAMVEPEEPEKLRVPFKVSVADQTTDDTEETSLAKGIKDVSKLKEKKFKVPKVGRNSKYLGQMRKLLNHMDGFAEGTVKTTFMLGGDPGTGKCLHGDYEISLKVSNRVYQKLLEKGYL